MLGLTATNAQGALEEIALLVAHRHQIDHTSILVPEHANEEHLQILATVSEMFSSKRFRDRLEAATEPVAIQRLFGEWASENDSRVR